MIVTVYLIQVVYCWCWWWPDIVGVLSRLIVGDRVLWPVIDYVTVGFEIWKRVDIDSGEIWLGGSVNKKLGTGQIYQTRTNLDRVGNQDPPKYLFIRAKRNLLTSCSLPDQNGCVDRFHVGRRVPKEWHLRLICGSGIEYDFTGVA